ncbi:AbrB/MazE/SpoVT family DNA-binding domain-containing protein [Thiothrix subterranea]|uniref:AbrB/MazE/SpoVT family DNA-binding domain-containing protein n=1 Tax=Thiothrix subterranea TaxID=2735563 RepID=UPI00192B96B8|nr:AbrB/MazE/SpoVT family DNA-binding domain-containing protein [Thiothrix subterranea]QQZ29866.1 AbrB/MazE/SpoVT family DNA-binding domain-containing protein [Thiothrix subterranea]
MQTATVSPKFQVVIPRMIREPMGIQPGQKMQVLRYGNRIELIPFKVARQLRGFLRGINTSIEREGDRV